VSARPHAALALKAVFDASLEGARRFRRSYMAIQAVEALAILRKLARAGDTKKINAWFDGKTCARTDVDFYLPWHHPVVALEAWIDKPNKKKFRVEFGSFHAKQPDVIFNGEAMFRERADFDTKLKTISVDVTFTEDKEGKKKHVLRFEYPLNY
jgi:hypothetical protein